MREVKITSNDELSYRFDFIKNGIEIISELAYSEIELMRSFANTLKFINLDNLDEEEQ